MDFGVFVNRIAGSEAQAWGWLLRQAVGSARRCARGYRMGAADANDLAQSVLLAVLERVPKLRDPACLPGWLATLVGRQARRALRATQRECPLAPPALPCSADADSPERSALRFERDRAVWSAVTCLPSQRARRLAWLLAYRPELTQLQLAAELDVAEGTIGPLRRRSLDALRNHLLVMGYDASDIGD